MIDTSNLSYLVILWVIASVTTSAPFMLLLSFMLLISIIIKSIDISP